MDEYVADTHALIWYLGGSTRLGDEARAIFDLAVAGEIRVLIPAIVIAELVMYAEKHKIIPSDRIISELRSKAGFPFLALLPDTAGKIKDFSSLPDIHDRLIVAETVLQGATLITFDKAITASGLVNVIW